MSNINMPGFTAEASLSTGDARYQATAEAAVHGGLVQPAFPLSDRIDLNQNHPLLYSPVYRTWPLWCLKFKCVDIAPPGYPPKPWCRQVVGIWNPGSRSCE